MEGQELHLPTTEAVFVMTPILYFSGVITNAAVWATFTVAEDVDVVAPTPEDEAPHVLYSKNRASFPSSVSG